MRFLVENNRIFRYNFYNLTDLYDYLKSNPEVNSRIFGIQASIKNDEEFYGSSLYEAIEYLKIFKGVFFDAQVVDVFLRFTAVYPVGTKVMLNNKVEAVVVRQNAEFPERPVLRILDNANPLSNDNLIDLLKEHSIFIDNVID